MDNHSKENMDNMGNMDNTNIMDNIDNMDVVDNSNSFSYVLLLCIRIPLISCNSTFPHIMSHTHASFRDPLSPLKPDDGL